VYIFLLGQPMWQVLLPLLRISPVSVIPPVLHAHLHLSRRTSGRRQETFKQIHAFSDMGEKWTEKHFYFTCSCCKHPNTLYSALIGELNGFGKGTRQNGHYNSFALQIRVSGARRQYYISNCKNCTQMSLMTQAHILGLMWVSILMANQNPRSESIKSRDS